MNDATLTRGAQNTYDRVHAEPAIKNRKDARWVLLETWLAEKTSAGYFPGGRVVTMQNLSAKERGEWYALHVLGLYDQLFGDNGRDGIPAEDDALFTFVAIARILSGSTPDRENDPTGDAALGRLYERFSGREALLLEESFSLFDFMLAKLGVSGDADATTAVINEYFAARTESAK